MKTFKSFTLVALFLFASTFATYANNTNPTNTKDALRTKIVSIIGKKVPVNFKTKSIDAKISFMINKKNEVVVVNVDSDNKDLGYFIKSVLNYEKVNVPSAKKGIVYVLPLTVNKA